MAYDPTFLAGPVYVGGKSGKRVYFLETADGSAAISAANYITNAASPVNGHFNMALGDTVVVTQRLSLPSGNVTGTDTYTVTAIATTGFAQIIKTSTT